MSAYTNQPIRNQTPDKIIKVRQILNKALNEIRKIQLKNNSFTLSRHCSSDD